MKLIYSRIVDKSVLCEGFTIQSCFLEAFTHLAGTLKIGERKSIKLIMGNTIYEGITIRNQPFNREKYPTHKEMYQIRYSERSAFAQALRAIYADLWSFIEQQIAISDAAKQAGEKRHNVKIPEELQCKIAFYSTDMPDVWAVETYDIADNKALEESLREYSEFDYERQDESAHIRVDLRKVKLRVLDKSIGNNLKELYQYRCQVCGEALWRTYGDKPVIDAHHISPFTQTQNNNYDNIMVLCPTHHRIIHANNGEFMRRRSEIWYPNGLHEPLKINLHL